MKYIGKHKVNGKDIYSDGEFHYFCENNVYVKMLELTSEQLIMLDILHSDAASEINF